MARAPVIGAFEHSRENANKAADARNVEEQESATLTRPDAQAIQKGRLGTSNTVVCLGTYSSSRNLILRCSGSIGKTLQPPSAANSNASEHSGEVEDDHLAVVPDAPAASRRVPNGKASGSKQKDSSARAQSKAKKPAVRNNQNLSRASSLTTQPGSKRQRVTLSRPRFPRLISTNGLQASVFVPALYKYRENTAKLPITYSDAATEMGKPKEFLPAVKQTLVNALNVLPERHLTGLITNFDCVRKAFVPRLCPGYGLVDTHSGFALLHVHYPLKYLARRRRYVQWLHLCQRRGVSDVGKRPAFSALGPLGPPKNNSSSFMVMHRFHVLYCIVLPS
jgi:hypothetical protein